MHCTMRCDAAQPFRLRAAQHAALLAGGPGLVPVVQGALRARGRGGGRRCWASAELACPGRCAWWAATACALHDHSARGDDVCDALSLLQPMPSPFSTPHCQRIVAAQRYGRVWAPAWPSLPDCSSGTARKNKTSHVPACTLGCAGRLSLPRTLLVWYVTPASATTANQDRHMHPIHTQRCWLQARGASYRCRRCWCRRGRRRARGWGHHHWLQHRAGPGRGVMCMAGAAQVSRAQQ